MIYMLPCQRAITVYSKLCHLALALTEAVNCCSHLIGTNMFMYDIITLEPYLLQNNKKKRGKLKQAQIPVM